jgi:hypothetical protein
MLTYNAHYQYELKTLIQSEIERLKDTMITAHITFDFPAYKHHVGVIEGLRKALDLMEEAESKVNGADTRG